MKNQTPMELNKRLAELLGWTNVVDVGGTLLGRPPGGAENSRDQAAVPNWAGDWAHAGPLSSAHRVDVNQGRYSVYCKSRAQGAANVAIIGTGRNAAACQAITSAVIAKLEARP